MRGFIKQLYRSYEAKAQGIKVKKGLFPWTASGQAIANGRDDGFNKLLFDDSNEAHGHGKNGLGVPGTLAMGSTEAGVTAASGTSPGPP
jgi:hypothetical protein